MFKGKFIDIVEEKDGFLRGPFGSALKKSLFVPKSVDTYKVYEQCVVLEQNKNLGNYYISKEYFDTSLKKFEVKEGDFLVSCSGVNYGAIYQLTGEIEKGVINQALLRIRINKEIVDENYFLYYFRSYIVKVITSGTGDSTIPNFPSMSVIKNIKIELPEIEQQRKIGEILKLLDTKIENNRVINSKLQNMLQTIYNYYFLQFDFPDKNGKPYKLSGGKMVWNNILKREIPENWEIKTLDYITEQVNGFAFSSNDYVSKGEYKLYTIKNVQDGEIISKVDNYINELPSKMNVECLLSTSDIIMSLTGNVGRIGLVYEENALLNQRVLKLKEINVSKEFLYSLLRNDFMKQQIEKIASGTSQKNLSPIELGKIKILVPPTKILERFNNLTNNFINTIVLNYQEIEELKALRDFLIPLLMNGQAKL